MRKNCLMCGEVFVSKRNDAKFCSSSCKFKHFELRQRNDKDPSEGIHGIVTTGKSQVLQNSEQPQAKEPQSLIKPNQQNNVDITDLTPFDNVFEDFANFTELQSTTQPTGTNEPLKNDILKGIEATLTNNIISNAPITAPVNPTANTQTLLPAKFIKKQVEKPNPLALTLQNKVTKLDTDIQACNTELNRLIGLLKNVENDTGNQFIVSGIFLGFTGGLFINALANNALATSQPALNAPKKSKTNKKIESILKRTTQSQTGSWLTALASATIGGLIGSAIKATYNANNTVSKAQAIQNYKSQIQHVLNVREQLQSDKRNVTLEQAFVKTKLFETIEIINPDYQKAVSGIAKVDLSKTMTEQELLQQSQAKLEQMLKNPLEGVDLSDLTKPVPKVKANPLETDKIQSMKNVSSIKKPLLGFKDTWLDFYGYPQTNFFCVIHGMSGEGKTNFAIQFAKYLAENFGNVLYVSGEEGFAPTFQQKIVSLGADAVPRLYAADIRTGEEILRDIPNQYHFIFIDSVNNMDIDPDMMQAIRNKFKQSGIVAICQSTKEGKIRGSYEIVHDSDIAVKVMNGIAITTKNRFKEKDKEFDVFAAYGKPKLKVIKRNGTDDNDNLIFKNTV
jgi:hypothetical protein